MRCLGIDFGLKRIGLALSDPDGLMAFPFQTLVRSSLSHDLQQLETLIFKEQVKALVVGLPLGLDGQETLTTRQAKNFANKLAARTSLPLHLVNEALTSSQAEEELKAAGLPPEKRKAVLDQQAAVIILRTFLESRCHDLD